MLYIKRFYGIIKVLFNLFASTIFYTIIQFSMEIINTALLIVLFFTCLFYFLKSDDNFVKEVNLFVMIDSLYFACESEEFREDYEAI